MIRWVWRRELGWLSRPLKLYTITLRSEADAHPPLNEETTAVVADDGVPFEPMRVY